MTRSLLLTAMAGVLFLGAGTAPTNAAEKKVRLFILSGQSNMVGMDENATFIPAINKAFPGDENIVVKLSRNGNPISRWVEEWQDENGDPGRKGSNGRHYRALMSMVQEKLGGKTPESVAFVWMQGEADAKKGRTGVYKKSLGQLLAQLQKDFKRDDVIFVLGRISDWKNPQPDDPQKGTPGWDTIREVQVEFAEERPLSGWVDNDDLNGKHDGLHYPKEGYDTLGTRFAEKTINLINQNESK